MLEETTLETVRHASGAIPYHGDGFTLSEGGLATIGPASGARPIAAKTPINRPAPASASTPAPRPTTFAPKPENTHEFLARLGGEVYAALNRPPSTGAPAKTAPPPGESLADLASHVYERMNHHGR